MSFHPDRPLQSRSGRERILGRVGDGAIASGSAGREGMGELAEDSSYESDWDCESDLDEKLLEN